MNIGVIGLGKMGAAVAYRLQKAGHSVVGYDVNVGACRQAEVDGIACAASYKDLCINKEVIWIMVPAGAVVDAVLEALIPHLAKNTIIVDGGNSKFTDSVRRATQLKNHGITYLDCGTSGGLHGREIGFSLMIGGERAAFEYAEPIFRAIAAPGGYGYMGPSGAGHYVKMVHNGIEYALLQAYAEGFHLLKEGRYKGLDLAQIANVWIHGSIIRSWLLELAKNIFEYDAELKDISGEVGGGSTGQWTVEEAHHSNIPVHLIEEALRLRNESHETGGNYATKVVALFREQFGGHEVKKVQR